MDAGSSAALLLLLGAVLALGLVFAERTAARTVRERVALIAGGRSQATAAGPAWPVRALRSLAALFGFRVRGSRKVATNPLTLLASGSAAAVALWLLASMVLGLPGYIAAIGGAVGFFVASRVPLMLEQRRTARRFSDLLPDAIDMIVRFVRAGLPISAAMHTVAQEAAPPVSDVFRDVANQAEIGVPLDAALARAGAEIRNPDFRFLAVAIALQQSTGGNLVTTLETLAQIIRKRRAVRLKAYAATAEVRLSAIVLAVIPFLVTGTLLIVAPDYLDPLFTDPRGHVILAAALLGLVLAGLTMRGLIRRALSLR